MRRRISREECYLAKSDEGRKYESTPFWAWTPDAGTCPSQMKPLFRAYNNRWRENDSNHRYSTDNTLIDEMVGKGWIDEGAVMCVEK